MWNIYLNAYYFKTKNLTEKYLKWSFENKVYICNIIAAKGKQNKIIFKNCYTCTGGWDSVFWEFDPQLWPLGSQGHSKFHPDKFHSLKIHSAAVQPRTSFPSIPLQTGDSFHPITFRWTKFHLTQMAFKRIHYYQIPFDNISCNQIPSDHFPHNQIPFVAFTLKFIRFVKSMSRKHKV